MADRKISDLTALTAPAAGDYLPIVDISEAAAANKNKRITIEELFRGIPLGTAAAPSVAIEGDENTGIYSPGADQLAISTGGTGRLFIDSTGNVGIGTTSPGSILHAAGTITAGATSAANGALAIKRSSDGLTVFDLGIDTATSIASVSTAYSYLSFKTEGTERARFDQGRLLVGTSSASASSRIVVQGNSAGAGSSALQHMCFDGATPANGDGLGYFIFGDNTQAQGAFIFGARDGGTWSGSSKPTRLVFSVTSDGASSPTEAMRINNTGSVMIQTTQLASTSDGCYFNSTTNSEFHQLLCHSSSSSGLANLYINRQASDGALIEFRQGDTAEGSISVSGTTVTYGGGHLARWSQLPDSEDPSNIFKGTIMSNLDEMCEWGEEDNEQLNKTKISDVEGDKNVAGVFVSTSFSDDGPLDFFVAMTGDMIIRIAADVTVERGDLLMSAGDGTAKPQDDDIIRSKTIAKVTSTNVSCTYEDGSYCVPCVLMAC